MPAYFSVCFTCEKRKLYPGLVQDFCGSLFAGGFPFSSGYWGCEDEPLENILAWNQKKLEEDQESGGVYAQDYRQIFLASDIYSEVRLFVLNMAEDASFAFHLVLPEDELIRWERAASGRCVPGYDTDKINRLTAICVKMWERPYISMIHTELELSEPAPEAEEIAKGADPAAEPFAILPYKVWQSWCKNGKHREQYDVKNIQRDGVVIRLAESESNTVGIPDAYIQTDKGNTMEKGKNSGQTLRERIIALIEEILEVPAGTITPDTLIEDVEEWDSLKHVEIIGALEEELSVNIPLEDAIELKSMSELLEKAGCL